MSNQQEVSVEELNYLDEMGEKALELLKKEFLNNSYPVSPEAPFPMEVMELGARMMIQVAVVNTPIRAFHVEPLIEGHLYLLNIQDKNNNTVADVIFFGEKEHEQLTIEDVIVTYKPGAILYRYEELEKEKEENMTEDIIGTVFV